MKTASAALDTLLTTKVLYDIADLYKFTLLDGTIVRWTTYDTNLTLSGNVFTAGVPLERSGLMIESGTVVSSMDIVIGAGDGGVLLNGVRLQLQALLGAFDGAKVEVDRLYMGSPGDVSAGVLKWFYGNVGEVQPSSTDVRLVVKSSLEKLKALKYPRRLFEAACPYAVFDARCGLSKAAFQQLDTCNGGLAVGATALSLNTEAGTPHAANYWRYGTVRFTSGAAAGLVRQVSASAAGVLTLNVPLPVAVANDDAATLLPGCDKQLTTCTSKFANQNRYGGFPFVPRPESIR
jgi:uncharacterized phage protein (TIGR02218 family)